MGIRTGKPRGRPAGVRNRRTTELVEAAKAAGAAIEGAIPKAFRGDAHALLMSVYKDPTHDLNIRIEAAKAAIRYEKPALAAVDSHNTVEGEIKIEVVTGIDRDADQAG